MKIHAVGVVGVNSENIIHPSVFVIIFTIKNAESTFYSHFTLLRSNLFTSMCHMCDLHQCEYVSKKHKTFCKSYLKIANFINHEVG